MKKLPESGRVTVMKAEKMKSVKDIRLALEEASEEERELLIKSLEKDERQGVQKLVERYIKRQRA